VSTLRATQDIIKQKRRFDTPLETAIYCQVRRVVYVTRTLALDITNGSHFRWRSQYWIHTVGK